MKEGNIIEQGNHEELMKQNGAYAELYNSQFELMWKNSVDLSNYIVYNMKD